MSFDKLVDTSVAKKQEEISFTVEGKKITFFAKELNMTQRIRLVGIEKDGGDSLLHWVLYSIVDDEGKHMTLEQASNLSDDVLAKFLSAALKVNSEPVKEAKKKRTGTRKRKQNK